MLVQGYRIQFEMIRLESNTLSWDADFSSCCVMRVEANLSLLSLLSSKGRSRLL
jgi:hypothetical protein